MLTNNEFLSIDLPIFENCRKQLLLLLIQSTFITDYDTFVTDITIMGLDIEIINHVLCLLFFLKMLHAYDFSELDGSPAVTNVVFLHSFDPLYNSKSH